jgi:hypothetical protein
MQMAVVQTGAMQLSVDSFTGSAVHHELKTDIQVKGVCVSKVISLSHVLLYVMDICIKTNEYA